MTIRRIVAATDFSETASRGLEWAEALARRHRAALTVVHAFSPPAVIPDYAFFDGAQVDLLRKTAQAQLRDTVDGIRRRGIRAEGLLEIGAPAAAVARTARRLRAGLLVIGTRGATGFRHLLLGSTAERLLRGAGRPVLAVHPRDRGPAKTLRTILVPVDFSSDARAAATAAAGILGRAGRIVLVHALHLAYDYAALGAVPPAAYFKRAQEESRRRLEAEARRLSGKVDVKVVQGLPVDVILKEARTLRADVIAMGTHGRGGLKRLLLGSTAERVIQHAPCPVLSVKAPGR